MEGETTMTFREYMQTVDDTTLLKAFEERAPLGRTCTIQEVGNSAVFLLSDMASAITGEILHVDCGYHAIG